MTQGIQDKVIVITGASSGLGEAAARLLSAQGASVVLGARRADRIQSLANELSAKGDKAVVKTTDVTDRAQVKALVDAAVQAYGRVDVMINNAGLMPQSLLERLKTDEWDRMIDVNIKGTLYGIAAALPYMKQQKAGHIVNVSSVVGHKVGPGSAVYAATKHAVRALSEGLRQAVKPYNIRTTVISPGAVATELPESATDPDAAAGLKKFYSEYAIPADSFARVVAYAIGEPDDVDINEILFRPTRQELRGACDLSWGSKDGSRESNAAILFWGGEALFFQAENSKKKRMFWPDSGRFGQCLHLTKGELSHVLRPTRSLADLGPRPSPARSAVLFRTSRSAKGPVSAVGCATSSISWSRRICAAPGGLATSEMCRREIPDTGCRPVPRRRSGPRGGGPRSRTWCRPESGWGDGSNCTP